MNDQRPTRTLTLEERAAAAEARAQARKDRLDNTTTYRPSTVFVNKAPRVRKNTPLKDALAEQQAAAHSQHRAWQSTLTAGEVEAYKQRLRAAMEKKRRINAARDVEIRKDRQVAEFERKEQALRDKLARREALAKEKKKHSYTEVDGSKYVSLMPKKLTVEHLRAELVTVPSVPSDGEFRFKKAARDIRWFKDVLIGGVLVTAAARKVIYDEKNAGSYALVSGVTRNRQKEKDSAAKRYGYVLGHRVYLADAVFALHHNRWPVNGAVQIDGNARNVDIANLTERGDDPIPISELAIRAVDRISISGRLTTAQSRVRNKRKAAFGEVNLYVAGALTGLPEQDLTDAFAAKVLNQITTLTVFPVLGGMPDSWGTADIVPGIFPSSGAVINGLSYLPDLQTLLLTTDWNAAVGGETIHLHSGVLRDPVTMKLKDLRRAAAVLITGNSYGFSLDDAANKLLDTILETAAQSAKNEVRKSK